MLIAALAFVCFVAGSAWWIRGCAWNWAWYLTMPFPKLYDPEVIYTQIKGRVFTKGWLASTLVGATMFATGWISGNDVAFVYLALAAISLVGFACGVITYKLFGKAMEELNLTFPPSGAG